MENRIKKNNIIYILFFLLISGSTGSYQPFHHGWHLSILQIAFILQNIAHFFSIASIEYCEQLG